MGSSFFPIFMLMLATACVGFLFGYKLGNTPISQDELEQIKEKAFNEAKEEYMRYFHNRFDPHALALSNEYVRCLQFENKELTKRNKELVEELERKKNESISSS